MAKEMGGRQAAMKEHNTPAQGRSGSGTPTKRGPAKSPASNPTKKGHIVGDR